MGAQPVEHRALIELPHAGRGADVGHFVSGHAIGYYG
jgi:hypothetical protein